MAFCTDKWTRTVIGLGYNPVRHPRARIRPLDLVGLQNGQTIYIGRLNELVLDPPETWPSIQTDLDAVNLSGERTSKLDFALGINILKGVIEGLGGGANIEGGYKNAKKLVFEFSNAKNDLVGAASVGAFLRDASIDVGNPVLREYLLGNGKLFVIVKTVKTNSLIVHAEAAAGGEAQIDMRTLTKALGSNVSVSASEGSTTSLAYHGSKYLVFGFQCLQLGFVDGELRPVNADARAVSMGNGEIDLATPVILEKHGLVDLTGCEA